MNASQQDPETPSQTGLDGEQARTWLTTLHGGAPGLINICATGAWTGEHFTTDHAGIDAAVTYISKLDRQRKPGIYARATTLRTIPPPGSRGLADLSLSFPGFWADIDIAGPGHKHELCPADCTKDHRTHITLPLPPDQDSGRRILDAAGLPEPTMWIQSGGGLYPWHLLEHPHTITPADYDDIATLSARWQLVIQAGARQLGHHYGSGVGDLARVLRVPGTINRKAGLERPCAIVEASGQTFTLDQLATLLYSIDLPDPEPANFRVPPARPRPTYFAPGSVGPYDALGEVCEWADLLEPYGFTYVRSERDGAELWKYSGSSAESEYSLRAWPHVLVNFSETAPLPVGAGHRLTHGKVFAYWYHSDNHSAAGSDLRAAAAGNPDASPAATSLRPAILDYIRQRCGVRLWTPNTPPPVNDTPWPDAPPDDLVRNADEVISAGDEVAGNFISAPENWPDEVPRELAEADQQAAYERDVAHELHRMRVREDAARRHRQERATNTPEPDLVMLDDFLAVEDEPVRYRIEGLWPVGGRILPAAQYKAGKTTLRDNLVRALVDGEKFLDSFTVNPPRGRIVLIDNELDERMMRSWLRDQRIVNTNRVAVLPLRGKVGSFDILDPDTRARWAKKIQAVDGSVVILDCLRPVFDALGLDENKDAGRFLVAFDTLLDEAGAEEAAVIHHMGHTGERSRGDSRLLDWPDVSWRLVRDKAEEGEVDPSAARYFSAYGRDVNVPEGLLEYDPNGRRLCLVGGSRRDGKAAEILPFLYDVLWKYPKSSKNAIEKVLVPQGHGQKDIRAALALAVRNGVVTTAKGARGADLHSIAGAVTKSHFVSSSVPRQRGGSEFVSSSIDDELNSDELTARSLTKSEAPSTPQSRDGGEIGICDTCGTEMVILRVGQNTHPTC
ncbi:MAG TPA: AAA family ATPase [Sporichthya sp.]|nr:AAA family ATPase [Sporichthya sp.]